MAQPQAQAIILGSGTSNGVPMLGVEYPPEFLANPKNHRTRPSCLLQGPGGNVLIDCGPEMRLQLLREGIKSLSSVIITHTHADHIMGMDDVRAFCKRDDPPMPVYTAKRYQDDIRRIFPYAFADAQPGIWVPRYDMREVPEFIFEGGLEIETLWVEHGSMPVLAVRVGDFAYVTDVNKIPENVWDRLLGLKNLALDGLRYRAHPNHYNYEQAIEVATALGAEITFFTHLSDDYDHDKVNAELPAGIQLAYDGLKIPIVL